MLDALIFDIDGTLLDSNPAHVAAWAEAFEDFGYRVAPDRIMREIGKGGDRLVPEVLGLGAAILAGVDTVVYAVSAPPGIGSRRVAPSPTGHHQLPRIGGGVLAEESRALLGEWLLIGTAAQRSACAQDLVATV